MTTRFKNAIDALVHAFFNDTLAKGDCAACAVGNMVAWSYGFKKSTPLDRFDVDEIVDSSCWGPAVWWGRNARSLEVALKTGYSADELKRIEAAFEANTCIRLEEYPYLSKKTICEDQHNGLMAVLDVLCEIEGIGDPSEYKELFSFA
jgi:hypothetical protein